MSRPTARSGTSQPLSAVDRCAIEVAMAFGVGRAPKAPGTFGSLPGLLVGAGIHAAAAAAVASCEANISSCAPGALALNPPQLPFGPLLYHVTIVALLAVVVAIAHWSIARTERVLGTHDDQRIVIDEVAGQAIAVAWLPVGLVTYAVGFALFRLFDIAKPGPVGFIDRDVPGAWGTLGDDLLAGVFAGLIALAALYFTPPGVI